MLLCTRACRSASSAADEGVRWRHDATASEARSTSADHKVLRHRRSRRTVTTATPVRLPPRRGLFSLALWHSTPWCRLRGAQPLATVLLPSLDIFNFQNTPEVTICSTYLFLQFDCIIHYFLYRALKAAYAAYASLNFSLLHYITAQFLKTLPFIRSTSKSRPNNIEGKNVRPPVRTSVRTSVRPQKVSLIWMKVGI